MGKDGEHRNEIVASGDDDRMEGPADASDDARSRSRCLAPVPSLTVPHLDGRRYPAMSAPHRHPSHLASEHERQGVRARAAASPRGRASRRRRGRRGVFLEDGRRSACSRSSGGRRTACSPRAISSPSSSATPAFACDPINADGSLPYADGSFDVACSLEVIEHIKDQFAFARELCRDRQARRHRDREHA